MYSSPNQRAGLGAWGDRPAGTWSGGAQEGDELVMQHCVLTKPGELPGSSTQDPNCPAGFELMETTAEDFGPSGVFGPYGGGIVADLSEWEIGPDGWLVHHPPQERPAGSTAPRRVDLGLEYATVDVQPWQLGAVALAAGALFLMPTKRAR